MIVWWLLLLTLTWVNGQDPRKRLMNTIPMDRDRIACTVRSCFKRSSGQDELGPFWANRGKKDPTYFTSRLYAEEPHWIFIRRDENAFRDEEEEPFFITRGKKDFESFNHGFNLRNRRDSSQDVIDSPFFAARGKRSSRSSEKSV